MVYIWSVYNFFEQRIGQARVLIDMADITSLLRDSKFSNAIKQAQQAGILSFGSSVDEQIAYLTDKKIQEIRLYGKN